MKGCFHGTSDGGQELGGRGEWRWEPITGPPYSISGTVERVERMDVAELRGTLQAIQAARQSATPRRSLLIGLSGIDGSGKGFVAARLATALEQAGLTVAVINVDGWLNLPARRFSQNRPAEHFYQHGLRLEEMFERLILPLCRMRSHRLLAEYTEETAAAYRPHVYEFHDVDVVLLEGIFIFKRAYRPYYDLAAWVDCTFATALERALARAQEGLPPAETIAAYETIYFPAQRLHFERDQPRSLADRIVANDPRLSLPVST